MLAATDTVATLSQNFVFVISLDPSEGKDPYEGPVWDLPVTLHVRTFLWILLPGTGAPWGTWCYPSPPSVAPSCPSSLSFSSSSSSSLFLGCRCLEQGSPQNSQVTLTHSGVLFWLCFRYWHLSSPTLHHTISLEGGSGECTSLHVPLLKVLTGNCLGLSRTALFCQLLKQWPDS